MIAAGATLYRVRWTDERTRVEASPVLVLSAPADGKAHRFEVRDDAREWAHYAYTLPEGDPARPRAVAVTPPGSYLYASAAEALDDARAALLVRLEQHMRDAALLRRQVEAYSLAIVALDTPGKDPA